MTKLKWIYAAKGHYTTQDGSWTVHVLDNGAVYKTHPSRATADVTGVKADRYVESAQTKFPVRGKRIAEPEPEPDGGHVAPAEVTTKPAKTPKKKRVTKKRVKGAAKELARGVGVIIGTTRAFVTDVGEAEEEAYAKRKAPTPKKKEKKEKKKAKPRAGGRPTIVRKKKQTTRRTVPATVTEHPLQYLLSGSEALPPTRRRTTKKRREQTLEEFMGF